MTTVMVEIQPLNETDEVQFVPNLDDLSESNRCSCTSSDDNPY